MYQEAQGQIAFVSSPPVSGPSSRMARASKRLRLAKRPSSPKTDSSIFSCELCKQRKVCSSPEAFPLMLQLPYYTGDC